MRLLPALLIGLLAGVVSAGLAYSSGLGLFLSFIVYSFGGAAGLLVAVLVRVQIAKLLPRAAAARISMPQGTLGSGITVQQPR